MDLKTTQQSNTKNDAYNNLPCGIVSFSIKDLSVLYSNNIYNEHFASDTAVLNVPQGKREWFKSALGVQLAESDSATLDYCTAPNVWNRIIAVSGCTPDTVSAVLVDVSDQYENLAVLKEQEKALREKVETDPLSKVYNRGAAIEKINDYIPRHDCSACALLVVDIDNFKTINDTYGHLYGDAIISMVGNCIKNVAGGDSIIGRFGGDEFFIFIKNDTKENIKSCAAQINDMILKMRADISDDTDISASIGIAYASCADEGEPLNYETLFSCADKALYMAKYNGKNRFEIYNGQTMGNIIGRGIGYSEAVSDEPVTTTSRDTVSLAIEILSKSKNTDNAVHNVMRHVGLQHGITLVQIMKIDSDEDMVTIEHDWSAVSNTASKSNKTGYYTHNDINCFLKRFNKKGYFMLSEDDTSDFSRKMNNEFAKIADKKVIYCANVLDKTFYMTVYHYPDRVQPWTDDEIAVILEITKMISVFLNKNEYVSNKERYLWNTINFEVATGLYNFPAFLTQASRIKQAAIDKDNDFAIAHMEFVDFYRFYERHTIGLGLSQVIEKFGIYLRGKLDSNAAVATYLAGSEIFIVAARFIRGTDIKKIFEDLVDEFFKEQIPQFKGEPIAVHTGIAHLPTDGSNFAAIHMARNLKGNLKDRDRNICVIDSVYS